MVTAARKLNFCTGAPVAFAMLRQHDAASSGSKSGVAGSSWIVTPFSLRTGTGPSTSWVLIADLIADASTVGCEGSVSAL